MEEERRAREKEYKLQVKRGERRIIYRNKEREREKRKKKMGRQIL